MFKFNKDSSEFENIDSSCASSSEVEILGPLRNSKHHLQQCFLRSAVNPHWYQIKLWQISCSGHHNSSLAILSCLSYRSYPIPVWPTLILMHKLLLNTPIPTHMLLDSVSHIHTQSKHDSRSSLLSLYFLTSQLLWTIIHPTTCCQLANTYTQKEQAVPHYQLRHLNGLSAFPFHPCHLLQGSQHCLVLPVFWQGLSQQSKPTDYCHGYRNHESQYDYLKWKHDVIASCVSSGNNILLLLAVKIISWGVSDGCKQSSAYL